MRNALMLQCEHSTSVLSDFALFALFAIATYVNTVMRHTYESSENMPEKGAVVNTTAPCLNTYLK